MEARACLFISFALPLPAIAPGAVANTCRAVVDSNDRILFQAHWNAMTGKLVF